MKLLYNIILVFVPMILGAQNSLFPDAPYTNLFGISVEGDNIISAGSCDQVAVSNDGGANWTYMPLSVDFSKLVKVPGSNGLKAYLMNNSEVNIFNAETGEVEGTSINPTQLLTGTFRDIQVNDSEVFIIGNIGISKSPIENYNWTSLGLLNYESSDVITSTNLTENFLYTLTRQGKLFKTDIEAETTQEIYDFEASMKDIAMGTDEVGYVGISGENNPSKTLDGGMTWLPLTSFSETSTVYAYGEDIVMSVNTNRIVLSTDAGLSSQYIPYNDDKYLGLMNSVVFDNDKMYMCGSAGMVLSSTDFGENYEVLTRSDRSTFYSMHINKLGQGIALGGTGLVVNTTDGGRSWTQMQYSAPFDHGTFNAGLALVDGSYLISTDNGMIHMNGEELTTIDESMINFLYNEDNDYIIGFKNQGGDVIALKSVDKGYTWELKGILSNGYGYAQDIDKNGVLYVSGNESFYYKSIDDGETWESHPNSIGVGISALSFYDEMRGIVTAGNTVYKTVDGGNSYTPISTGYLQRNLEMISEDHYILTNAQNSLTNVRETKDGGETWNAIGQFCSQSFSSDYYSGAYCLGQRWGHINNVLIDTDPNSTDQENGLAVYPRKNFLNVGEEYVVGVDSEMDWSLVSSNGELISSGKMTQGLNSISTMNTRTGVYFIIMSSQSRKTVKKMVIY